ncbi:MAG: hypothetical protein ACLRMZ_24230 [Blautia marasmi]
MILIEYRQFSKLGRIARFKAIDCKRNYLRRSRKYVDIEGQFIGEHAGRQMLKVNWTKK